MRNLFILTIFGIGLWVPVTFAAGESEIYFRTTEASFAPGSEFVVGVFLTSPVPINAISAEIGFSANVVEWMGSNTARSIVRIWKDSPRRSTEGMLVLEGGIPASFQGRAGELIELYFKVKEDATQPAQISLRNASLFRADGTGSEIYPDRTFLSIPVSAGLPLKTLPALTDATPPTISFFQLATEPVLGRTLVVWDSSDMESGIVTEEISTRSWFWWSPWVTQKSPASITDGVWGVRVAVTDRAGNRTKEILYDWAVLSKKVGVLIGTITFLLLLIIFVRRRRFGVS